MQIQNIKILYIRKDDKEMKKFVCNVCGYVHEGDAAPEKCPQCNAPASKFTEQSGEKTWAARSEERRVGKEC